jgi:UTP:GlnB (protein PII) uridylyltransferase
MFEFTSETPLVTLQNWAERGYSIVNVQCKDRSKLLFDVVFNLTDMEYVVFHATIHTRIDQAYLVIIRHHQNALFLRS